MLIRWWQHRAWNSTIGSTTRQIEDCVRSPEVFAGASRSLVALCEAADRRDLGVEEQGDRGRRKRLGLTATAVWPYIGQELPKGRISQKEEIVSEALTPARIMEVGMAFWPAKTLLSAVELGLFTTLAPTP